MGQRIRIKQGATEVLDITDQEGFRLGGVHYPPQWFARGGTLPVEYVVETYTPPPPPLPTTWLVPYVIVLERMTDANADAFASFIAGSAAKIRERLKLGIPSDSGLVRGKLLQLGEDPEVILART